MRKEHPVVALLRRARRRINAGWCRFTSARMDDSSRYKNAYCSIGAVRATGHSSALNRKAYYLLRAEIPTYSSIPEFNDAPGTTKQDVLDVFDRAIRKARRIRVDQPSA